VGGGGTETRMGFSRCAHARDMVAVHMDRSCAAVWWHRATTGGAVATLSKGCCHDRFQN
jgi:hypothetical protein